MAYIGNPPLDVRSFGTVKFEFTATNNQTDFTGTDDNNKTLAFTEGQIEVYVNGVLMDSDDFSTSGGNTVTLASAAAANDIITVNTLKSNAPITDYVQTTGGTFTGGINVSSGNVGLGFTAPPRPLSVYDDTLPAISLHTSASGNGNGDGFQIQANSTDAYVWNYENTPIRFGTNGAERMQIDSSGNLLVGKTSADFGSSVGFEANSNDTVYATRSGGASLTLNRTTSDGDIALFRKDDTTVGSIGTASGNTYIGSGDTGIAFSAADDTVYPITTATGGIRDAAIDLGGSTYRYKDLYLSGTANISANHQSSTTVSGASGGSVDTNGGDIITGRIFVTGYSDSGSELFGINNESTGLVFYNYTDSKYLMKFSNSNYINTPNQPSFFAKDGYGFNTNGYLSSFGTIQHNIGGHFNNSTGQFTAPITGRYLFTAGVLVQTGSGRLEFKLNHNGSTLAAGNGTGTTYDGPTITVIVQMNANDYVRVDKISGTAYNNGGHDNTYFGGYLLG